MCYICRRHFSEMLPKSEFKVIKQNKTEIKNNLQKSSAEKILNKPQNSKEFRVNDVNIQMISRNIYEQLFQRPTEPIDHTFIKR